MRELSGLSDVILLGLVADKDEAALREIVERHSPWLLLRLLRKTPDRDLAHEALHDTFVAVWKHPRSFRGDGDLGARLWGIAIRQLASRLRKRAQPIPIAGLDLSMLSPTVRSAEDELLIAVEHGPVGDALRSLSPELRQVMQATVVDGLSTKEAAHLLGIPQGTVKSRARVAKARLREQLMSREAWS
ncbi:RNA polymerase sigma factor [Virgisporangium aurantiacum]|uniref:RNA polymerase sigma24 factor n=1 Tax=Virgisporangium aurantiacum TaxID=175570 RepID=A0A8J3ZFJ3_9ACTN|nr:RNA polymerase sigma factor [Virgisporangium aurantiacum]GIJ63014.1 RNA polymerase sigma24 factor [Virgisporangium aurantiacum]